MTLVVGKIEQLTQERDKAIEAINVLDESVVPYDVLKQTPNVIAADDRLIAALSARVKELEDLFDKLRAIAFFPKEVTPAELLEHFDRIAKSNTMRIKELEEENADLTKKLNEMTADSFSATVDLCTLTAIVLRGSDKGSVTHEDIHRAMTVASELSALRRSSERAIEMTHELCSCGGSAPDDPKACDACRIYHALTRLSAEKGEQG